MLFKLKEEDRWEIVRSYKQENVSMRQLARQFKSSLQVIQHVIKLYKETGTVHQRFSTGRPSIMKDDTLNVLDRIISKNDTATSTHLAHLLQQKSGRRVSPRTIRRARQTVLARHPVHETIVRTLTEGDKTKRLKFAKKYKNDSFHNKWFTDECNIVIAQTGQVHWHKSHAHAPTREVSDVLMRFKVWGGINYYGKTELCFCEEAVTKEYYCEILGEYLLPCMRDLNSEYLIQDNWGSHTSPYTHNWLVTHGVKLVKEYPPWSPCLNAIEHVWSWMVAYISKQAPTTKAAFKRAIESAWSELPDKVKRRYIDNVPGVCARIIAANGDHI